MNRHLVRARLWLLEKGMTQTQIARKLGVSRPYLHLVLAGKKKSPALRIRLIKEVGLPPHLVNIDPDQPTEPEQLAA